LKAVVYHGIAASLLIGMAIVVYATGSQGLNTYGTCSFKESLLFAYTGIAFVIFYLLLGSYTLYCFRKQIPDSELLYAIYSLDGHNLGSFIGLKGCGDDQYAVENTY
jgi:hypothetical protein